MERRAAGKKHCHANSREALGSFLSNAPGRWSSQTLRSDPADAVSSPYQDARSVAQASSRGASSFARLREPDYMHKADGQVEKLHQKEHELQSQGVTGILQEFGSMETKSSNQIR
jgi:hypothetical protein